jgi:hypothetical protein
LPSLRSPLFGPVNVILGVRRRKQGAYSFGPRVVRPR